MSVAIPQTYTGLITSKAQLAPAIIALTVTTPEPVPYQAGQYAAWLLNDQRRPMSFASAPGSRQLKFLVDTSPGGVASHFTQQCRAGNTLRFLAPYGQFIPRPADKQRVYIATGTGVAPFRAMIEGDGLDRPTTLVYGVRRVADFCWLAQLTTLARENQKFTFLPVSLEPTLGWEGLTGHVADVAFQHLPELVTSEVYLCGSPELVLNTRARLTQWGVPPPAIRVEQFSLPGHVKAASAAGLKAALSTVPAS